MTNITIQTKSLAEVLEAQVPEITSGMSTPELQQAVLSGRAFKKEMEVAFNTAMKPFEDLWSKKKLLEDFIAKNEIKAKEEAKYRIEEAGEVIKGISVRTTKNYVFHEDKVPTDIKVGEAVIELVSMVPKLNKALAKKFIDVLPKDCYEVEEKKSVAINELRLRG